MAFPLRPFLARPRVARHGWAAAYGGSPNSR
jgi:hypothetical protein